MRATRRRASPRRTPDAAATLLGWIASVVLLCPALAAAQAPPTRPFPQHVDYAAGTLRPSHRTQAQQDQDVRALHAAWKSRYLAAAGTTPEGQPRYRVRTGREPDAPTVSEGQGYGMIATVLMAGHDPEARTIFDGLWSFSLDHPSEIDPRLSDWLVAADEIAEPEGNDSAFDGDADIAYALLLAAQQWEAGGRFDYAAEAARVLAGLRESVVGPASRLPLLGDWVQPDGAVYSQYSPRPSDFLPDHFRAFARATGVPDWLEVGAAVRHALASLQDAHAPATGLLPDFAVPSSPSDPTLEPAPPDFLEGPFDGDYYYNSARVPLRLGLAAVLGGHPAAREAARRISRWAESQTGGDPTAFAAGYRLDGTPLPGSGYLTTAFLAPLGVAAMATPGQQAWLDALYEHARLSDEDYYEDTLSLLALLVMSGNYWSPAGPPAAAVPATTPLHHGLGGLVLLAAARRVLRRRSRPPGGPPRHAPRPVTRR